MDFAEQRAKFCCTKLKVAEQKPVLLNKSIFAQVYGSEQKVPSSKILLYKTSLLNKNVLLLNKNIMSKQLLAVQNIEQIVLLNKSEFAEQKMLFAEQKAEPEHFFAEQKQDLLNKNVPSKMLFSKLRIC